MIWFNVHVSAVKGTDVRCSEDAGKGERNTNISSGD